MQSFDEIKTKKALSSHGSTTEFQSCTTPPRRRRIHGGMLDEDRRREVGVRLPRLLVHPFDRLQLHERFAASSVVSTVIARDGDERVDVHRVQQVLVILKDERGSSRVFKLPVVQLSMRQEPKVVRLGASPAPLEG